MISVSLGVFAGGELAAYLRIHEYGTPWMAYDVFSAAVPDGLDLRRPGWCEVSRLAVAPAYRQALLGDGKHPVDVLYQALFAFCLSHSIRESCMIVSGPVLRAVSRRGVPCRPVDPRGRRSRGDTPVFATLDWGEYMRISRPEDVGRVGSAMRLLREVRRGLARGR